MMRIPWLARVGAGALVCATSCGGSGFSSGGGSDAGGSGSDGGGDGAGSADGGLQDGPATEGGAVEGGAAGVACGPQTTCSGVTPVCCLGGTGPSCAHVQCGCDTQLECASDLDCQAPTGACCIDKRADATCTTDHFVARCAVACTNGAAHLCNPNAQKLQCLAGQCSNNSGDLQNVGLPAGPTYGVCK